MAGLTLIYQSDSQTGTPRLKTPEGSNIPFSAEETRDFETLLAKNYNDLSRSAKNTITFLSRQFNVSVEGSSRMPKLILREAIQTVLPMRSPPIPTTWLDGLLTDVNDSLANSSQKLDDFERNQLEFAVKEFRSNARQHKTEEMAFILLANYLSAVEQLAKAQSPIRASMYTTALKALEKLIADESEQADSTRQLSMIINNTPQPDGILKRAIQQIFGQK